MGKRFNIIYADPPWQYHTGNGMSGTATNHYHTMNLEEIRSLPVASIADNDCILFLWVTFPCLQVFGAGLLDTLKFGGVSHWNKGTSQTVFQICQTDLRCKNHGTQQEA